jgi:hypothetical protein
MVGAGVKVGVQVGGKVGGGVKVGASDAASGPSPEGVTATMLRRGGKGLIDRCGFIKTAT